MATDKRNINKQLAAMEDLAQGIGTTNQVRGGIARTVHRIDVPVAVETQEDMQALDINKFTRARVYSTPTIFTDYVYDENATSGIQPDIGVGYWVVMLLDATKIDFSSIPTVDPLQAGAIWNDAGTLKISAG